MIDIESLTKSCLKLFLSVDVSGSTALKNQLNHTTLLELYQDRKKNLSRLNQVFRPDAGSGGDDQSQEEASADGVSAVDECGTVCLQGFSLDDSEICIRTLFQDWTIETYDWAAVIAHRLSYFHGAFLRALEEAPLLDVDVSQGVDRYLWKAVGDELIYVFEIHRFEQIHQLVTSFLSVLREFDAGEVRRQEKLRSKAAIRFKGSGWVAGFPVRNRRAKFRGPDLYTMIMRASAESKEFTSHGCPAEGKCSSPKDCEKAREYPYPKVDYLGPDIDTGFRLGKHIHPGLLVVSMELAELLGRAPKHLQQVRGAIVGWEILKGVWDGNPYPIIWITLPENLDEPYSQFCEWAAFREGLVKKWRGEEENGLKQINHIKEDIERIRKQLPASLGVVAPYVVDERDPVPPEHQIILNIVKSLYRGVGGEQNQEGTTVVKAGPAKPEGKAEELLIELGEVQSAESHREILFRKFRPFSCL